MKVVISMAFLSLIAASAAQAETKIETRVFHSNLRLDAKEDPESFENAPGIGVNGIYVADPSVDLGFGYSFARYNNSAALHTDLHTVSAFARYKLNQTENGTFYALLGVSNLQLDQDYKTTQEGPSIYRMSSTFDPLLNGDIGLGGSIKVGSMNLGLEYKYSSSLSKGSATGKLRKQTLGTTKEFEGRISGINAETQEVSLSIGVSI